MNVKCFVAPARLSENSEKSCICVFVAPASRRPNSTRYPSLAGVDASATKSFRTVSRLRRAELELKSPRDAGVTKRSKTQMNVVARAFWILTLILIFVSHWVFAATRPQTFTIIQLNDVYEIFPVSTLVDHTVQMRGGLAYAATLMEAERKKRPVLVLHAGDFISPSLLSIKFKHQGAQMVDAMNALKL